MDDKNLPTRLEKVTTLVFIRVNQRFLVGMGATWGGLVFLSSFSDCWLDQLLFNTCLHRRSPIPPTTHLSAVRQREPSWEELVLLGVCFLYLYIYIWLFFFFIKAQVDSRSAYLTGWTWYLAWFSQSLSAAQPCSSWRWSQTPEYINSV